MGKSIPSSSTTTRLQDLARIISSSSSSSSSKHSSRPKQAKPISKTNPNNPNSVRVNSKKKMEHQQKSNSTATAVCDLEGGNGRLPLAQVVSECVKRWFQDTLKEAKAGDSSMQVLVGQMYNSGYGVARDTQKGRAWINKASRVRSSVWKVSEKQPGYNASDSDSDDMNEAK